MTDEMNAAVAETDIETGESVSNDHPAGIEVYGGEDGTAQATAARELQGIVESLLFVSQEPLSIQRLAAVIGDVSKADIAQALQGLGEELEREGRGIRLAEIAGGFRLVTKQEYASWIKRMDKTKSAAKLSRSALESLAIIAYKQPIVRGEIEEIRGVEASGVVRTLLERKLVRIVGRKEVPGRPIMYGTTKYFLEHFGLNDLSQLPPLREFKELGESEQALLPMDGPENLTANGSVEMTAVAEADLTLDLQDALPETGAEMSAAEAVIAEAVAEITETVPEVTETVTEVTEATFEVAETVMEVEIEAETEAREIAIEPALEAEASTSVDSELLSSDENDE
jgi:segregation and condensation protein B